MSSSETDFEPDSDHGVENETVGSLHTSNTSTRRKKKKMTKRQFEKFELYFFFSSKNQKYLVIRIENTQE